MSRVKFTLKFAASEMRLDEINSTCLLRGKYLNTVKLCEHGILNAHRKVENFNEEIGRIFGYKYLVILYNDSINK